MQRFPSIIPIGRGAPPLPLSANERAPGARRELPLGATYPVPPHPGWIWPNPRFRRSSIFFFFFFSHFYFPASSGQAVVTGIVPSSPRFLPSIFIAHRVQQSHCLSIFHRVLLTHALALSASQFVHKKKVPTNLYEYALGGARTHETDLYQARG